MADRVWRNWAGNVEAAGFDALAPASTEEVAHAVTLAARTGRRVKPIGSGHSFTAIGQPVDLQLQLHRLTGVVAHDPETGRVRVRAGSRLRDLNRELHALGLAFPNLGDYDGQTVSGAIATGTHGTGAGLTGLAGFVRGVEMVLADESVARFDDDHQPELVPAVTVGLGALGVVTELELQCVPTFLLRAEEAPDRLDGVLERLDETIDGTDHFEFYFFPHTDLVQTKTNTRVEDLGERAPLPRWRRARRPADREHRVRGAEPGGQPGARRDPARQPGERAGVVAADVHRSVVRRPRHRAHRPVHRVGVRGAAW